jgi:hypothetical protein
MSLLSTLLTTTKSNLPDGRALADMRRHLPGHAICVGLGALGGATGVTLVIGLVIVVQSLLFPEANLSFTTAQFTIAATLLGGGISWLIGRWAHRVLLSLEDLDANGLKLILIFSVFTSLLQAFFFTSGL